MVTSAVPAVKIDAQSFPHILERIVELAPRPLLLTMRTMSRTLHKKADAQIYQHIVVVHHPDADDQSAGADSTTGTHTSSDAATTPASHPNTQSPTTAAGATSNGRLVTLLDGTGARLPARSSWCGPPFDFDEGDLAHKLADYSALKNAFAHAKTVDHVVAGAQTAAAHSTPPPASLPSLASLSPLQPPFPIRFDDDDTSPFHQSSNVVLFPELRSRNIRVRFPSPQSSQLFREQLLIPTFVFLHIHATSAPTAVYFLPLTRTPPAPLSGLEAVTSYPIEGAHKHVLTVLFPAGAPHLLAYACLELDAFADELEPPSTESEIVLHVMPGTLSIKSERLTSWRDPHGLGLLARLPQLVAEQPSIKVTVVGLEGLPRCVFPLTASSVEWDLRLIGEDMFGEFEAAMCTAIMACGRDVPSEGRVRCVAAEKYRTSVGAEQYALETVPPLDS
jgi:hypothetical protein